MVLSSVAASLLLAACGGGNAQAPDTPRTHQPSAVASAPESAAAPSAAEKSRDEVLRDFRFAITGIEGSLKIVPREALGACHVEALLLSPTVMDKSTLLRVISRLQERGWKHDGPESIITTGAEVTTDLKSGIWTAFTGVTPLPEDVKAKAPSNTTGLTFSVTGHCTSPDQN